jgi:hypothetical protein
MRKIFPACCAAVGRTEIREKIASATESIFLLMGFLQCSTTFLRAVALGDLGDRDLVVPHGGPLWLRPR